MATSGAGAGLCKMSLEYFVVPESKEMIKKKKEASILQGNHSQLDGVPLAKSGKTWALKELRTVMNYKPLRKTGNCGSVLLINK